MQNKHEEQDLVDFFKMMMENSKSNEPAEKVINLQESPFIDSIQPKYKKIAFSLPTKSMLMQDDSGLGKSNLMAHWQWLAKQQQRRCLFTSENKLMSDLFLNEYGTKTISPNYMDRIRYCQIFMLDEMFNSKNWISNFNDTYFTIGSLIEELYEYKKQNQLVVIVATNNPIEKFLQEKSIVRKFNELFMYD